MLQSQAELVPARGADLQFEVPGASNSIEESVSMTFMFLIH